MRRMTHDPNLTEALRRLRAELISELTAVEALLPRDPEPGPQAPEPADPPPPPGKRTMSAEARAQISKRMKKYWRSRQK
jgi:hypothetical protein